MRKKIISHIKEYWKINLIVFLSLFSLSILFLYCQNQEFSVKWLGQSILIPYFISCIANLSTAQKEHEKISLFKKKDMEMTNMCSEILGFLKCASTNKKVNEKDLKHLLSLTKKLQMSISSTEQN